MSIYIWHVSDCSRWIKTCFFGLLFRDFVAFKNMFEFQAPLCFGILFATLGSLFCLTLLLRLIHFERNHHFRTLIDQLITSMYWYGILWIFTLQVPTTIRYIVGPFPTFVCAVDVIYRNVFTMQVLFFWILLFLADTFSFFI